MKKIKVILLILVMILISSISAFAEELLEYTKLNYDNEIEVGDTAIKDTLNSEKATLIKDPFEYSVYAKGYKTNLKAGQIVDISMQSKDFVSYIMVLEDIGTEDENIVAYGKNVVRHYVMKDKTYYIIATTASNYLEGDFELSVTEVEEKTYYVNSKTGKDENTGLTKNKPFATLNQAVLAIEQGTGAGKIYLMTNVKLKEVIEVYNTVITILPYENKEYKIERQDEYKGEMIEVYNGTLNLGKEGMEGKIVFEGNNGAQDNDCMICNNAGIVNMYDGVYIQNNNQMECQECCGTIYNSDGIFNMYGGEIINNSVPYCGGGIYNTYYALVNMYGGKICYNTAYYGGGIFNEVSTLNIEKDAEISHNTAIYYGGGVYDYNGLCNIAKEANITENIANCEDCEDCVDCEEKDVFVYQEPGWNNPFIDVNESDWYYETVQGAVEFGLFKGTTDTTFEPKAPMTKRMFVTVLARLSGENPEDPVEWALNNSVASGMGERAFEPSEPMNREEMAVMLYNFINVMNAKLEVVNENPEAFFDEANFSTWSVQAIKELQKYELIQGKQENFYDAFQVAGRAEVAALLLRLIDKII